jgi:hypothetical protein
MLKEVGSPREIKILRIRDDFRAVRNAFYGKDDGRQLQDMRRSGAGEAIQGGSRAEQLSGKI